MLDMDDSNLVFNFEAIFFSLTNKQTNMNTQILTDTPDAASVKRFYAYVNSLPRAPAAPAALNLPLDADPSRSGGAAAGPVSVQMVR